MREPGEVYLAGTKGNWNVRCVAGNPGETDRCEIQQLLFLNENTPVADISIFKLPEGEVAIAAANIMVPLETLLTKKFQFAFSKEIVKEYPYSFCNKNGCLVRLGLLEEDVEALKKGSSSKLSISLPNDASNRDFLGFSFFLTLMDSFGRVTLILLTTIGRSNCAKRFKYSLSDCVFPENEISKAMVSIAPSTLELTDELILKIEGSSETEKSSPTILRATSLLTAVIP